MFISDLLGGNEIKGFENGIVIVNGEQLAIDYYELIQVCGNVPLGEVSDSYTLRKRESSYLSSIKEYYSDEYDINFVKNNKLMHCVSYSTYEIDIESKTLILKIDAFDN